MLTLALVCLLAPFVGFVVQYFLGKKLPRQGDIWTVAMIGASLVCAILLTIKALNGESMAPWTIDWYAPGGAGSQPWQIGLMVDGLTAMMLVVVTVVSFLVHVFSIGYMKGDAKYPLFFAWLQMFSVAMLMVVLADDLLLLFIGWELVGLCSYKLIGFWSEKKDPANAARKAFITTRIGDVGMVLSLMIVVAYVGSFDFGKIAEAIQAGTIPPFWLTIAGLGIVAGAAGKSAQFGFHVWLPDAMEGPTPVSALIHAATMVAAGVYLVGRTMWMLTPDVLYVVAALGAMTGIMAGFIAVAQNDIKKVLAYSTVSQLGYMFLGLGVGAWHAALFHLATHAFFKALMFLGSGSVIHACHHEQDMRKMGGLWKKLPVTGTTFLLGVLAIAGLPFFSGFYSKDAILAGAYHRFPVLFWIGLAAAVLTAFYMMRLFVMTFLGKPKDQHIYDNAHEGGFSMQMPLVVLGILAVIAGYGAWHWTLMDPAPALYIAKGAEGLTVGGQVTVLADLHHFEHDTTTVAPLAIAAGIGGLALGWLVFAFLSAATLTRLKKPLKGLESACSNKFFFDEFYREALLKPTYAFASFCGFLDREGVDGAVNAIGRGGKRLAGFSGANDKYVVDGAVKGVGASALAGGGVFSRLQSGRVRFYLSVSVGVVAVILVLLLKKSL